MSACFFFSSKAALRKSCFLQLPFQPLFKNGYLSYSSSLCPTLHLHLSQYFSPVFCFFFFALLVYFWALFYFLMFFYKLGFWKFFFKLHDVYESFLSSYFVYTYFINLFLIIDIMRVRLFYSFLFGSLAMRKWRREIFLPGWDSKKHNCSFNNYRFQEKILLFGILFLLYV